MKQMIRIATLVSLSVQLITAAALLFLPFGFDHPSSLGLDFNALILVSLIYCITLATGIICAVMAGNRVALCCQAIILMILILRVLIRYSVATNQPIHEIEVLVQPVETPEAP